jgi:hypothetical protein
VTRTNSPLDVRDLIKFMGHTPTPENPTPGLGLTYSEVVGAIYEIQKQGGIPGAFATEKERMIAKLASAAEASVADERPENDETEPAKPMPKANPFLSNAQPATVEAPPGSMVVPLTPIKKKPN